MSSILTNYGAMVALQNLQATQRSLTETQNHISSGLKVATARDDASAWTIASTMKSNVASLNQVSQNLGNADSILGTAVSGATQISKLVSSIRAKVATFTDTDPATQQTNLDAAMKKIDAFAASVQGQAAQFGAVQQNVQSQKTFVTSLANSMQQGVSNMVDADMTAESARLSALQTQQQLGTQALSIANQAPQMILKLFG